jgi:hypothetical protein
VLKGPVQISNLKAYRNIIFGKSPPGLHEATTKNPGPFEHVQTPGMIEPDHVPQKWVAWGLCRMLINEVQKSGKVRMQVPYAAQEAAPHWVNLPVVRVLDAHIHAASTDGGLHGLGVQHLHARMESIQEPTGEHRRIHANRGSKICPSTVIRPAVPFTAQPLGTATLLLPK